jgi:mannose-6-phosphate isomerase-like protein (cupin superfamily)
VTTQLHRLHDVDERYVVIAGMGVMRVGSLAPETVIAGDVVVIPAARPQQITNIGEGDLVFYCVCSPRFTPTCYEALEE